MKNFLFIIVVLMLLYSGTGRIIAQSKMYVKEKNGLQTAFTISEVRRLAFPTGKITVSKTNSDTQSYVIGDIRYISFKNYETGIENHGLTHGVGFKLYPNPVQSILHIECTGKQVTSRTIEILDMEGKVIKSIYLKDGTSIDVSNLKAGIYFCRIQDPINSIVAKFIKN